MREIENMHVMLNAMKAAYDRSETQLDMSHEEVKSRALVIDDHKKQLDSYMKALKVCAGRVM